MGKSERTRERLAETALELFERQGFEQTTVGQIAAAAGVTEMTFFRHFPAKHQVLFEDPYDALIADAVAAQPGGSAPLRRAAGGLRQAWSRVPEPDGDVVRRRVRIVAGTPSLRGEMWRNNSETERLVAEQLVRDGARPLPAKAAAAAVLAAVTAALLEWSVGEDAPLGDAVLTALETVEGGGNE
ncbi:TetR family transcriptional regulator [Streptomyces abyssalis]|uniref:TetR family transcriptional regulator n=1 Tax=Streptomyces abyssalis TaxID=933944 RepID=A0A1E7JS59_9ACTN|nr:TetR/AcrR family transcriptional regulator [Streptomyces abyssalis]OEU91686.1 TetR family transcriptional regulator [Streptomyces abyssalis]OEU94178.1 TetR family transcriptional regulator [Streptomyces abyssalis]OEV06505.1 TetR family transcriptional regulator [Streptomyces nanshensis]